MPDFTPLRSVLYMPSSNERALEKAKSIACDGLILDLEDAVAPDAKPAAREAAAAAAASGDYGRRTVTIRVNGLGTQWHDADIVAASPRMQGLSLGPADLAADRRMKTTRVGGGHPGYLVRQHPVQIKIANKVFSPSVEDVKHARRVIAAMGDGTGAVMLDGKMEDDASVKQCQVMVALAEELAAIDPDLKAAYDQIEVSDA